MMEHVENKICLKGIFAYNFKEIDRQISAVLNAIR